LPTKNQENFFPHFEQPTSTILVLDVPLDLLKNQNVLQR